MVNAHDLHPDYASTRLAVQLAAQWGVPAYAVAHHHAHIAAICAEHGLGAEEPVLGLAIDGIGLGSDGGLWGGELLRVQGVHCERLGHVQALQLPGGERAASEPWRMAVSALHRAGQGARAASGPDFLPLLVYLCDCEDAAYGAALFHATVAHGLAHWLISVAQQQGLTSIAIGGGCAMNGILMQALRLALLAANLTILEARQAPPGDGGLALGQAWVASMLMKK